MKIGINIKSKARLFLLAMMLVAASQGSAQTDQPALPSLDRYVNDFAGILDPSTTQRLEALMTGLKERGQIEFAVVTVKTTGGTDIFDFSKRLANSWGMGPRSSRKRALLLLISVDDQKQFTQISKDFSGDLPDGLIAEVNRRMLNEFRKRNYSGGIATGVQTVIATLAEKLSFVVDGVDASYAYGSSPVAYSTPKTPNATLADQSPLKSGISAAAPGVPSRTESVPAAASTKTVSDLNSLASEKAAPSRDIGSRANAAEVAEDEEEEVETTLALPVAERIEKLRSFIATHEKSAFKARAIDLIIGAKAAIGDQKLKAGDKAGGIEQFKAALAESPANMSDALFDGVIVQIPFDLFVREERAAAFEFARDIADKVGDNPKRLLALAAFYLRIESPDEALRLAERVLKLNPEMAEAHVVLGTAKQINFRLDEAAAEYARALELDPKSVNARRGLSDLRRAEGKFDTALALYREGLKASSSDKSARAGLVISLLESGLKQEGATQLAAYMKDDPRNISLLVGAAYWYAAHNESGRALELAKVAADLEPRYTWAHIALARALVAENHSDDAERALRYALQYGHYPTLDYELASTLMATGLYAEAAETLAHAFTVKAGQIETKLAGRVPATAGGFIELLAPERRASIFQLTPADTESNAAMLKALLELTSAVNSTVAKEGGGEADAVAAGNAFASGSDAMRPFRQLYVAEVLLSHDLALQKAISLTDAAASGIEPALGAPGATVAVLADTLREARASAINAGGTPAIPVLDRGFLSKIARGRIEEIAGSALLKSGNPTDAVIRLRRAVSVFPTGTIFLRDALWRLGGALEAAGKQPEALAVYIKSYNGGAPDLVRRAVIEGLYRRINGNINGLDEKIGAPVVSGNMSSTSAFSTVHNEAPAPAQDTESRIRNAVPAADETKIKAPVTVIDRRPDTNPSQGSSTKSLTEAPLTLQVGSYKDMGQAEERVARLIGAGVEAKVVKLELPRLGVWYRVQSGNFRTHEEAQKFGEDLRAKKIILDFIVTEINAPPQQAGP